jgi:hypothetical protein
MTRCTHSNLPPLQADRHSLIACGPARHYRSRPQPTAMIGTADPLPSLAIRPRCCLFGTPGNDKLAVNAMVAKQRSLAGSAARL